MMDDIFEHMVTPSAVETSDTSIEAGEEVVQEVINEEAVEAATPSETPAPTAPVEVIPAWIIPISDDQDAITVAEYGQVYKFSRVMTPNNVKTDKFMVFNRKESDSDWKVLNGMLSSRYSIAATDVFIENMNRSLNIQGTPIVQTGEFKVSWIGNTINTVPIFEDEAEKIILAIVTGIDIELLNHLTSNIAIQVTNSFDGKAKLRLDYVLNTAAMVNGEEKKIRNFFALGKYSFKVIHGSTLAEMTGNISDIATGTAAVLAALKTTQISKDNIDKIVSCFNKEAKGAFATAWDGIVPEQRNVYNSTIVASAVLDRYWNIGSLFKIRAIYDKLITSIVA